MMLGYGLAGAPASKINSSNSETFISLEVEFVAPSLSVTVKFMFRNSSF